MGAIKSPSVIIEMERGEKEEENSTHKKTLITIQINLWNVFSRGGDVRESEGHVKIVDSWKIYQFSCVALAMLIHKIIIIGRSRMKKWKF